ncbi:hypothetical protein [Leucobacter sp. BZR 635]
MDCDISGQRFANEEWLSIDEVRVRTPRFALSSALVVVGLPMATSTELFDATMGWIVAIDHVLEPAQAGHLNSVIGRLGVAADQTLIIGMPGSWELASALWKRFPGSSAVFVAGPKEFSAVPFPGTLSTENIAARLLLEVSNRQELRNHATFLLSDAAVVEPTAAAVVRYKTHYVSSNVAGGYRKLFLAFAGALAALAGGGTPRRYFEATLTGGHNPPYPGWLSSLAQSGEDIERMSAIRVAIDGDELSLFGYDVRETRPALGWGARKHSLVLRGQSSGYELSVKLGALRREALDTLGADFSGATQAFAAFTLPGGESLDLGQLPVDRFSIEVLDEASGNLATAARVTVAAAASNSETHEFRLELAEDTLWLVKSHIDR